MMSQGRTSNITGNQLEVAVKTVLIGKGFTLVKYREWIKSPEDFGTELLLQNVPFTTVYGHRGNTEFLLVSAKYNLKTRIECKWQQVSGSVDEKLPYMYLNMVEAMPEQHIMVLIDGQGWKTGAIEWLKIAVKEHKYDVLKEKKIQVFSLIEFFTWANQTFIV